MELNTLVIYDVEDDWARNRVAEACKDFGLERIQYSCFRGLLSRNKREELYERMRKVQRDWEIRWRRDFPELRIRLRDYMDAPDEKAEGRWEPAFKILIQPICEKDLNAAAYAYLFVEVPPLGEVQDLAKGEALQEKKDDEEKSW
jgi:CRISPR-associated protein Cas2